MSLSCLLQRTSILRTPTLAISTRIPFGLFLNVGGNNENIAKLIVWPEAAVPSTVTVKIFAVDAGVVLGLNLALT